MKAKTSKTAKIRTLLEQGKSVKEIARRLKIKPTALYQVRWRDEKAAQQAEVKDNEGPVRKPKEAAAVPVVDMVNHPPHYTVGGIETIDFIEAKDLNFRLGNAVKYIARAGKKEGVDPIQDLEKAAFYLKREIDARKGA